LVTEFEMPNPEAKDPHTMIFDRHGIPWFTLQNATGLASLIRRAATSGS